ncbi:lipopolysaccharide biosynthesis protein [Deinococcus sonorensis]|uniref:Lipopolysaccharide biosynthesis protein n=2 Tax=Deinococcus sonorensis TaxID=309891 RepID=A0AAU7UD04_9DEIO
MTLRTRTVNAVKWSTFSFVINALLTPVFAAILARLLTPAQFGVVALGMALYLLGQFLADLGVGPALVQKKELTPQHVHSAFGSSVLLGLLVTALGWFTAPLAGQYFHNPDVVTVFRGFSLTYLPLTLTGVAANLLRRDLRFRAMMVIDTTSYIVGHGLFGLGSAYLGYGATSLVISVIAQNVILLSCTMFLTRRQFGLAFHWSAMRELYSFGGMVSVVTLLEYFSSSLDTFLVGRFYNVTSLGLYNSAYRTVCTPLLSFTRSMTRVLASSFSAAQDQQERLRRAYLTGVQTLSVLTCPIAVGVLICAPEIVHVLLGPRFAGSVPIMQVFAMYIPFMVLTNISGVISQATARLGAKIVIQSLYLVGIGAGFLLVHRLGLPVISFAAVLAVASALRWAGYMVVVERIIGGGLGNVVRSNLSGVLPSIVVGVPLFLAVLGLRAAHTPLALLFVTELLLGGGLMLLVVLNGPETEAKRMIQGGLRRVQTRLGRGAAPTTDLHGR